MEKISPDNSFPMWRGIFVRNAFARIEPQLTSDAYFYTCMKQDRHSFEIDVGQLDWSAIDASGTLTAWKAEAVTCWTAEMHSDEYIDDRWCLLGLIDGPTNGPGTRVCTLRADQSVEDINVYPGDVFLLDIHKAHAARAQSKFNRPLLFWSIALSQGNRAPLRKANQVVTKMADYCLK